MITTSPVTKIKKIALLMAMRAEAEPLIRALDLKLHSEQDPVLPIRIYSGHLAGGQVEIILAIPGVDSRYRVDLIGTEPAALCAHSVFLRHRPDICINAGTAGGFIQRGARIGDVYLSDGHFRYHDHRIPIPGFDEYGRGSYPSLDVSFLAKTLDLKKGTVSTGNALDHTEVDLARMAEHQADAKEMEAAAIAWVASLHRIPFFAVKSITDLVDSGRPSEQEFLENLARASHQLRDATLRILEHLSKGHPITASTRKKLVVVADDWEALERYEERLQSSGLYDIECAPFGKTGLEMAESHSPDLLLVDLALEDMSAEEFQQSLRASHSTRSIPCLFVVGPNEALAPNEAKIQRPYTYEELLKRLKEIST